MMLWSPLCRRKIAWPPMPCSGFKMMSPCSCRKARISAALRVTRVGGVHCGNPGGEQFFVAVAQPLRLIAHQERGERGERLGAVRADVEPVREVVVHRDAPHPAEHLAIAQTEGAELHVIELEAAPLRGEQHREGAVLFGGGGGGGGRRRAGGGGRRGAGAARRGAGA